MAAAVDVQPPELEPLRQEIDPAQTLVDQQVLDIVNSYNYDAPGYLGSLTAEEESKLRELWVLLAKELDIFDAQSLSISRKAGEGEKQQLRSALWTSVKHDHPDVLLLRFLRARKWDPKAALNMILNALKWRTTEFQVDSDIMKHGEERAVQWSQSDDPKLKKEGDGYLSQVRMGKSYLCGKDYEGRAVFIVRVKLHHASDQTEASLKRFIVHNIETARMLLRPPVDTAVLLFDMTGFTLANMDYVPVKFIIQAFEANYPESLSAIIVHSAPWIFTPLWRIIRGWMDPVVASKIHFTKSVEDIAKFMPDTQIPKEIGGKKSDNWNYLEPVPGENDIMSDDAKQQKLMSERDAIIVRFEEATLAWVKDDDSSTGDKEKHAESLYEEASMSPAMRRYVVAKELKDNYWELDPYLRARSVYDRLGWLPKV